MVKDIRELLSVIESLKLITSSRGTNTTSLKYKLVEEIINEHIFEQMESPIVLFFKDLFTQKRKLGPENSYKPKARIHLDDLEVSIHIRSARNLPIR